MNYRAGLFRLWITFTIIWVAAWGYAVYGSYTCQTDYAAIARGYMDTVDKLRSYEASAPEVHVGGLNKQYYKSEAAQQRQLAYDNMAISHGCENAYGERWLWLVSIPLTLLLSFPVFRWILVGFKPKT